MTKQSLNWNDMYELLVQFRADYGHCNVPAQWRKNLQLGRWVAVQRYRRKIGELPPQNVKLLDKLSFIWSASDSAWNAMHQQLVQFKQQQGDCDVPTQWPENPHLANWVANQRHRRKKGTLSADRVRKLEAIGFVWSVYRHKVAGEHRDSTVNARPAAEADAATGLEERLYHVGVGIYVQYNGVGKVPAKIDKYVRDHNGEYPPYIPLPTRATEFRVGGDLVVASKRLGWAGKGPLPEEVLDYVCENGVLPSHR